jgi:hypothetical protein
LVLFALTLLPSPAAGSGLSIQPTTAPAEASSSDLLGVSCASEASCIAVGSAEHTGESGAEEQFGAFTESWNGADWTLLQAPIPGSGKPTFFAVSCASATFCVAVGNVTDSGGAVALAESWNGASWTVMPAPRLVRSELLAVSCPSATSCVAVGSANGARPLAEHWNGSDWTVLKTVSLPYPHAGTLQAVSCVAENVCVAAGYYQALHEQVAAAPGALVERWNGTRWTLERANPRPIRSDSTLSGVSCASASSCVAVGASWPEEGNGYPGKPLTERWNGKRWAITPSATVSRAGGELEGVSCTSAQSCTAVGQLNPGAYPLPHGLLPHWTSSLLVEHWNGTRWAVEPAQQPASANHGEEPIFSAVSCVGLQFCVAVGDRAAGPVPVALAEG